MKPFGLTLTLIVAVSLGACVTRIAPLSPHRPNSPEHRAAQNNAACIDCHAVATLGKRHQASDDCLRCHRIVQGD